MLVYLINVNHEAYNHVRHYLEQNRAPLLLLILLLCLYKHNYFHINSNIEQNGLEIDNRLI